MGGLFNCDNLQQWIDLNMTMAMDERENSTWMSFWATTCYKLWFWRNKLVNDDAFVMPMNPCTEIKREIHHFDVVASMVVVNTSHTTVIEEIS